MIPLALMGGGTSSNVNASVESASNVYNTGMMLDFDNAKPTSMKYNSPNGRINGDGCCDWSFEIM